MLGLNSTFFHLHRSGRGEGHSCDSHRNGGSGKKVTCGSQNMRITADAETWLRFLRKEVSLIGALLRRKIRIQGQPRLRLAFGRRFSS